MADSVLAEKSFLFAKDVVKAYEYLKVTRHETIMSRQLLKCGTSIGANVHEANYAVSRPDFIAKMHIALKECFESEYWLKLLTDMGYLPGNGYLTLLNQCLELRRMLVATCKTAKSEKVKSEK
jgi:four helix bundle protein